MSPDLRRRIAVFAVAVAVLLPVAAALARSPDRNKPLDIEAGSQSGIFSADSVNILAGGVHITQGRPDITSKTSRLTMSDGQRPADHRVGKEGGVTVRSGRCPDQ